MSSTSSAPLLHPPSLCRLHRSHRRCDLRRPDMVLTLLRPGAGHHPLLCLEVSSPHRTGRPHLPSQPPAPLWSPSLLNEDGKWGDPQQTWQAFLRLTVLIPHYSPPPNHFQNPGKDCCLLSFSHCQIRWPPPPQSVWLSPLSILIRHLHCPHRHSPYSTTPGPQSLVAVP